MKKQIYFLLIFYTTITLSQNNSTLTDCLKITYTKLSNGKEIDPKNPIWIFTNENETLISSKNNITKNTNYPIEQTIINRKDNHFVQLAELNKKTIVKTIDSISIHNQKFELTSETKTILGYKCKKAKTVINSNQIEIWYTNDLKVKGAPTTLGQNIGLVLELNRNNNFLITAVKIEKLKNTSPISISGINVTAVKKTDLLTYRDLLWKSRFKTIKIFDNESVSFSDSNKSNDSILKFANGTVILKKITLPNINNSSKVFIDLQEESNGDAYDRTGTVFMIPTKDDNNSFIAGLKKGGKNATEFY